jgi:hypothetical protein
VRIAESDETDTDQLAKLVWSRVKLMRKRANGWKDGVGGNVHDVAQAPHVVFIR